MKVYGYTDHAGRRIVAAKTKKAAAEAFGISLHTFNLYVSVTANCREVDTAIAYPGTVFRCENHFARLPEYVAE